MTSAPRRYLDAWRLGSSRFIGWSLSRPEGVQSHCCKIKAPDRAVSRSGATLLDTLYYAAFTSIFLAAFCASGFFGNVTVRTPFLKLASILSASTLSGIWKERSNDP